MQKEEPTEKELYIDRRTDELQDMYMKTGRIESGNTAYNHHEVVANIYDKPENGKAWDAATLLVIQSHEGFAGSFQKHHAAHIMKELVTAEAQKIIEQLIEKEIERSYACPQ